MKKYVLILAFFGVAVFLSGCSLVPASVPSSSSTPVVVSPSSIMKSTDGGKNWEPKSKTSGKIKLDSVDVLSVAINPNDSNNVLVGTLKSGIFKTEDGGENWSPLVFPAGKVYGLAIDPVDGRIAYASGVWQGRGKLFKTINGGIEWNEIYTAPSNGPLIIALTLDKKNPNILFVSTSDNQVIKSIDAGNSWKNIYVASSPVIKIAIDSVDSNLLYLNTLGGSIFVSKNGGEEIIEMDNNNIDNGVSFIESDPTVTKWVYAAGQIGLFRSKDAGVTWAGIRTLGDSQASPVKAVTINPQKPTEIIYGAGQALYKSVDDGVTWMTFQLETKKNVSVLKYDANNPEVVYLGLRK